MDQFELEKRASKMDEFGVRLNKVDLIYIQIHVYIYILAPWCLHCIPEKYLPVNVTASCSIRIFVFFFRGGTFPKRVGRGVVMQSASSTRAELAEWFRKSAVAPVEGKLVYFQFIP